MSCMYTESAHLTNPDQVETLVGRAYATCKATLVANRALLDELTKTLIRDETVGPEQIKALVAQFGVPVPAAVLA